MTGPFDHVLTVLGRWGSIDSSGLDAFFASAEDEGLTWETKATEVRPEHLLRAGCGFANSVEGGVLVLGARRDGTERWQLPGVRMRDEPGVWAASAVRRLAPPPPFDVKVLTRSDADPIVLILIRPVATPPCITPDGRVFERTTGRTDPVTDPAQLARLFSRGDVARSLTAAIADSAVDRYYDSPPNGKAGEVVLGLALASTGYSKPLRAALFNKPFADSVAAAARVVGSGGPVIGARTGGWDVRGQVAAWLPGADDGDPRGIALATQEGGVAVLRVVNSEAVFRAEAGEAMLRRCWDHARQLLADLGGYGPTRVVIRAKVDRYADGRAERWLASPSFEDEDVQSVLRELARAAGEPVWEPGTDER